MEVGIKENLELLSNYELVDDYEDAGRNGVVSHLSAYTINGASNEFLNKDDFDIVNELRDGKIVIIDVSNLTENSLNLINLAVYSSLQSVNEKNLKPVSIIIDEAQKILHKDYLPETDVCRESRFEYIFATQSEVLLKNKLSSDKFDELISNIATRCSFATNNNDLEEIHEYIDNKNRTYFAEPLFINQKDLFEVEVKYQKEKEVFSFIEEDKNNCFYLKLDAKLFEQNRVYKVFEDGKKVEVDFYVKGNYIPVVTVEQKTIEQDINTLVQEITLQNFKIEEKKQIIALAYAINVMDNKISDNERSIAQLRVEKEEIEKEFAGILKNINSYKKVSN